MVFKLSAPFILALAASVSAVRNSLYVLHEVESPGLGLDGLTPIGVQRASTCIPNVFRNKGIGKIISCTPDLITGACWTAVSSVQPLADELGLEVDTSCGNGEDAEDDCVIDLINNFAATSTKAILVVWDAGDEDTLYENIEIELPESDDDDGGSIYHHDEYVTIRNGAFISFSSQDCPNIDGQAPGTGVYSRQAAPSNSKGSDAPLPESDSLPPADSSADVPPADSLPPADSTTDVPPVDSSAPADSTTDVPPAESAPAVKKRSLRMRSLNRRSLKMRTVKPRQRRSVSRL